MNPFHVLAFAILGCLLLPASALAGPSTSGGNGYAIVCRAPDSGVIEFAELLDLYEARVQFGWQLPTPLNDLQADYLRGAENALILGEAVKQPDSRHPVTILRNFLNRALIGPHSVRATNDVGSTISPPKGCALEAVAFFYDANDVVHIREEIWLAFDSLSQAALVTHELEYQADRFKDSVVTSEETRARVGRIYRKF